MNYVKKISKIVVEKALKKKIKSDIICMGVDVAQHNTGIAIIRTTKSSVILDYLHLIEVPKDTEILDAIDLFIDQIERVKEEISKKYKLDLNMIEDCFFLKNVATLKALARFGTLVYDRFRGIAKKSIFILPTSARSKINFKKSSKDVKGKELKKELVEYVNKTLKINIVSNDEADAIILALAGIVE